MKSYRTNVALLGAISMALAVTGCSSSDNPASTSFSQPSTYAGFPITLKDATHDSGHSVSYKGQMARHVLRESAKAATKGVYEADLVEKYIKNNQTNSFHDENILAPSNKGTFVFKEERYNDLGSAKVLYDSLYSPADQKGNPIPGVLIPTNENVTLGMPGAMTAREVIDLWTTKFEALNAGNVGNPAIHHDMVHGYDYNQLFPKYLMGALFYNQAVDKYLDEYITSAEKPNDEPYGTGKHYTGKEHSWDEGFGYWGAAAHYGELTAEVNFKIKKKDETVFAQADKDGDGKVSMYTEYNSGPAYYAALFDKGGNSTYGKDMMNAWLAGRTLIANAVDANGDARVLNATEITDLAAFAEIIQSNWEMVFAEAVYRYAGLSYQKIVTIQQASPIDDAMRKDYYKMWSEMKGFMLALQYGGTSSKIDLTNFEDIDNLIGYGPVLDDGSQVTGISSGDYVLTVNNSTLVQYKIDLTAVQTKLDAFYGLKAKLEPIAP